MWVLLVLRRLTSEIKSDSTRSSTKSWSKAWTRACRIAHASPARVELTFWRYAWYFVSWWSIGDLNKMPSPQFRVLECQAALIKQDILKGAACRVLAPLRNGSYGREIEPIATLLLLWWFKQDIPFRKNCVFKNKMVSSCPGSKQSKFRG